MATPRDLATEKSENTRLRTVLLLILLGVGLTAYLIQQRYIVLPYEVAKPPAARVVGPASHTGIDRLDVKSVNFWEARVEVTYSLEQHHGNGYVSLFMEDQGSHHTVGLKTTPGQGRGIALLSRHFNRPDAYTVKRVRGQMYDPYRRDRNYVDDYYAVDIQWPSADELDVMTPPDSDLFSAVDAVLVYRNIPNYSEFAKALVAQGTPPELINFQLAVCRGCTPSLIFGEGVPVAAVQATIRALASHGFPIDKIEYSTRERHVGDILIGQTPNPEAKSFWNIHEAVAAESDRDRFFELIGFAQPPAAEQAVALTARAKAIIDGSWKKKNLERADALLDRALELDSSHIPVYLQKSRVAARLGGHSSNFQPSEGAATAIQILNSSLKIDPDFADTYVMLGYYQTAMHQLDDAKRSFERAETLGTDNLWLYKNRANMHVLLGNYEAAVRDLEVVLQHEQDGSNNDRALRSALVEVPGYYTRLGRYAEAQAAFEQTRDEYPGKSTGLAEYAWFLATYTNQLYRYDELVKDARRLGCCNVRELEALRAIIDAADVAASDEKLAIEKVVRAQSSGISMPHTVARLAHGAAGRAALARLIPGALSMQEVESERSALVLVLQPQSMEARTFLLKNGADANLVDRELGLSPLMVAVASRNPELVSELVAYGGDPHETSPGGISAIALARELDDPAIIAALSTDRT